MDFSPRYPVDSSSDSSTTVYTGPTEYQLNFPAHWSNMYSTQNVDSLNKHQLVGNSVNENKKNYNFGRMYSTKQSLSVDNMANQPKKETLWQSITRSATNLLGEHLTRGTGSLIKNWSSFNTPLSVTVVSPDFYKSLQQGKEHTLVHPAEGYYNTEMWNKNSHSDAETLPNVLYDNEIMSDSVKMSNSYISDSDKRWKEYKSLYIDFNGIQEKDLNTDKEIVNSVSEGNCKEEDLEPPFNIVVDNTKDNMDQSTNFGNILRVDDEPVIIEKPEPLCETQQEQMQQQQQQKSTEELSQEPIAVSAMLTNAYKKVVNGVVDLLQFRSTSPDADASSLFTKRACSPKPKPKKLHNISSGRGRGRAKSQLRRSGVSQKRHRKERSRYDRSEDIKSDIDNWEELEYNDVDDEKFEGEDVCDFATSGQCNDDDVQQYMKHSTSFTFADIKPKIRKPKKGKNGGWTQLSVAFSLQSLDGDGGIESSCRDKIPFRSRLLSECSVDSEDSYCIVFENDDCSEESDYETESESSIGTETETETESESEEEEVMVDTEVEMYPKKVRFNPTPVVHKMVQWNYAYRAARPGPWEQMGRDRERFRSRISCIGRILEPVLNHQHRMRVLHERFSN